MSTYDNDPRVTPNPDGKSWRVFDGYNLWWTVLQCKDRGLWYATVEYGAVSPNGHGKATRDETIHALIGDPR